MSPKKREKIWHRVMRTLYNYRGWWVDAPTLSLLGLYHWHFYSRSLHPVPEEMPETCWVILGMYILVKEGVRWVLHSIQSRRGSILVALWLLSMLEFFFIIAAYPIGYQMPSKMIETTLIVLGSFLGVLPLKRIFLKKFPMLVDALEPHGLK